MCLADNRESCQKMHDQGDVDHFLDIYIILGIG